MGAVEPLSCLSWDGRNPNYKNIWRAKKKLDSVLTEANLMKMKITFFFHIFAFVKEEIKRRWSTFPKRRHLSSWITVYKADISLNEGLQQACSRFTNSIFHAHFWRVHSSTCIPIHATSVLTVLPIATLYKWISAIWYYVVASWYVSFFDRTLVQMIDSSK